MPLALFFLLRIVLAMQALFWFYMKFKVVFSSSVRKVIGSSMGDNTESINCFGHKAIFMIFILSNHEHGMFLHLFVSSLISLSSGL